MPRVLLLPGLMGTGNIKRDALAAAGYDVLVVAFQDDAAEKWQDLFAAPIRHLLSIIIMLTTARSVYSKWVSQAQAAYDEFQPDIVVASSRGGSVAMTMRIAPAVPIVLLAPAYKWFRWIGGRSSVEHSKAAVIHCRQDERIPFEDSISLCQRFPQVKLVEAGSDHSLNTDDATQALVTTVRELLGDSSR